MKNQEPVDGTSRRALHCVFPHGGWGDNPPVQGHTTHVAPDRARAGRRLENVYSESVYLKSVKSLSRQALPKGGANS